MKHLDKEIDTEKHLCATFQVYRLVRRLQRQDKITDRLVEILLGNMLGAFDVSWRVVGITQGALEEYSLRLTEGKKSKRVERAHVHNRMLRSKEALKADFKTSDELWGLWHKQDYTVLCLSNENQHLCTETAQPTSLTVYQITQPSTGGRLYFENRKTSFAFSPKFEGEYLRQLLQDIRLGEAKVLPQPIRM